MLQSGPKVTNFKSQLQELSTAKRITENGRSLAEIRAMEANKRIPVAVKKDPNFINIAEKGVLPRPKYCKPMPQYEVDLVLAGRVNATRLHEVLVLWKGYRVPQWIPARDYMDHERLLELFNLHRDKLMPKVDFVERNAGYMNGGLIVDDLARAEVLVWFHSTSGRFSFSVMPSLMNWHVPFNNRPLSPEVGIQFPWIPTTVWDSFVQAAQSCPDLRKRDHNCLVFADVKGIPWSALTGTNVSNHSWCVYVGEPRLDATRTTETGAPVLIQDVGAIQPGVTFKQSAAFGLTIEFRVYFGQKAHKNQKPTFIGMRTPYNCDNNLSRDVCELLDVELQNTIEQWPESI